MGAFYSGTDNNDDKNKIYYSGVIGKITPKSFEYVLRFNMYETKVENIKMEDLFDVPNAYDVDIPSEWLNKVKQVAPHQPPFHGYAGYQHHSAHGQRGRGPDYKYQNRAYERAFGTSNESVVVDMDGKPISSLPDWSNDNPRGSLRQPTETLKTANSQLAEAGKEEKSRLGQEGQKGHGSSPLTLPENFQEDLPGFDDDEESDAIRAEIEEYMHLNEAFELTTQGEHDADEHSYNIAQFGLPAAQAKRFADSCIDSLYGNDYLLADIIRRAYSQLGNVGKVDIERNGLHCPLYVPATT